MGYTYCWLGLVVNERIRTLHGISSSHFAMAPSIKERLVFFYIFYPNLEPTGKHTGVQAQLNTADDFAQKPRVNRPLSKEGDNAEPASSSQTSRAPYFP